jgi:hypothetical protein
LENGDANLEEAGEVEQKLRSDLASCTTLQKAALIATKISALKYNSQFKNRSAASKKAGQILQKIILENATTLNDHGRTLVGGWTPEVAADTIINSQKKIHDEETPESPAERQTSPDIEVLDSQQDGPSKRRKRVPHVQRIESSDDNQ